MTKENIILKGSIIRKVAQVVSDVGMKVAENDDNKACVFFVYQPKRPEVLKSLNEEVYDNEEI